MASTMGPGRRPPCWDFGISAFLEGMIVDEFKSLTVTREILGTPAYAAPEQLRGEQPTIKSDLYAWGLVFLECIVGRRVFDGPSSMEIAHRQLSPDPVALPARLQKHWLGTVLKWTLEKDAGRRAGARCPVDGAPAGEAGPGRARRSERLLRRERVGRDGHHRPQHHRRVAPARHRRGQQRRAEAADRRLLLDSASVPTISPGRPRRWTRPCGTPRPCAFRCPGASAARGRGPWGARCWSTSASPGPATPTPAGPPSWPWRSPTRSTGAPRAPTCPSRSASASTPAFVTTGGLESAQQAMSPISSGSPRDRPPSWPSRRPPTASWSAPTASPTWPARSSWSRSPRRGASTSTGWWRRAGPSPPSPGPAGPPSSAARTSWPPWSGPGAGPGRERAGPCCCRARPGWASPAWPGSCAATWRRPARAGWRRAACPRPSTPP